TPRQNQVLRKEILGLTPGIFKISYPQYLSYFDQQIIKYTLQQTQGTGTTTRTPSLSACLGTLSDWFYADQLRTFFVRHEMIWNFGRTVSYYEDIKSYIHDFIELFEASKLSGFLELLLD